MSSPLSPSASLPLNPHGSDGGSDSDNNGTSKRAGRSLCRSVCPPPSFHATVEAAGGGSITATRPYHLFPLFLMISVANMADRSIIAGASQEFSAFVSGAADAPALFRENPSAGIGLLQASFIFGYSIAILLSGHLVHTVPWKPLVLLGLCVFWLGMLGSGNAKQFNSFYVLLFSRMATGCSEAAFQVVAPPLIQDRGGRQSGLWLSIYLMGQPVGLSLGYIYGSQMATSETWGWDWAYYWMCIGSFPLLVAFAFVKDETNGGILSGADEATEVGADDGADDSGGSEGEEPLLAQADERRSEHPRLKFTLLSEIKACLSSPALVTLSLGLAAMIGVVASLGTFGGAFILALQLFDDEREAAYWFGIAVALAGVIGTPLGGKLADKVLERYTEGSPGGLKAGVEDSLRFPIIVSMTSRVNMLLALALCFVFPTLLMKDAVYFLTFLFIGWTLLFMTVTGINYTAMLSVDRCHRPNALAFMMLTSHLLGDVPLPVVLGLVKDTLAPACRVDTSGGFVDPEQCKEQEVGVRQSLAVAYAWVLWSLMFFELCRRSARWEIGKARRREHNELLLQEEDGTGRESPFRYYHSRFQPAGVQPSAGGGGSSPLDGS